LIGIEASGSAHYWARVLGGQGHTVRLMAPQFVKPYVKSQKNDANDAEAICEAVTRPNMRFVPQKSIEQQDLQCLHRVRSRLVSCRTQLINQVRVCWPNTGLFCRNIRDRCAVACLRYSKMRRTSLRASARTVSQPV